MEKQLQNMNLDILNETKVNKILKKLDFLNFFFLKQFWQLIL